MKTFYLLRLHWGANSVMEEVKKENEGQAITHFQANYPELKLNNNGYAQPDKMTSYAVAVKFGE